MQTNFNMTGELSIRVLDSITGEVKDERTFKNGVTTVGITAVLNGMSTGSLSPIRYMAIGSGTTAFNAGQTALVSELARVAINPTPPTVGSNFVRYVGFFGAGVGTGTINEFGTFTAASAGSMYNRATPPAPITKGALDTLEITWTVTLQ